MSTIVPLEGHDGIVDFHDFFVETYWKPAKPGQGPREQQHALTGASAHWSVAHVAIISRGTPGVVAIPELLGPETTTLSRLDPQGPPALPKTKQDTATLELP